MEKAIGAAAVGGFVWAYVMLFCLMMAASVALVVFWVWMLVEVLQRETDENNQRLLWTLVIVFTHSIGALIYLLVRRRERVAKLGR
jgi:hypothetical protein